METITVKNTRECHKCGHPIYAGEKAYYLYWQSLKTGADGIRRINREYQVMCLDRASCEERVPEKLKEDFLILKYNNEKTQRENYILHQALQVLATPLEYKAVMLEIKSLSQTKEK